MTFNNMKELGIHSRQAHKDMYLFRCNYKDCFDCYRMIDALVKHCRTHGKETWDATHRTEDKKDRYKCSLCPETFDQVAQLLSHTQVHEENKYKCDECEWHFYLIAGLTCHGQDCHDTRYHACMWCVEYFDNADELHTHIRRKHHFECTICYDISPTVKNWRNISRKSMVDSSPVSRSYKLRDIGKRGWNKVNAGKRRPKQRQGKPSTSHARSVWKDSTQRENWTNT